MIIFLYHQIAPVSPQHDPLGLAVPPDRFEAHMRALYRRGWRCVPLSDYVAAVQARTHRTSPWRHTFALTFDDGFQDVYTTVRPILRQFGFTAAIFPVVNHVGRYSEWAGQDGERSAPLLTWEQLAELARAGFEIGSHTLTHPRLPALPLDALDRELNRSRQILEERLGVPVTLLSYPYSAHTPAIQQRVATAGYQAACGGNRGAWSVFNLRRTQCLRGDGGLRFRVKAAGWQERSAALLEDTPLGQTLRPLVRRLRRRRKED